MKTKTAKGAQSPTPEDLESAVVIILNTSATMIGDCERQGRHTRQVARWKTAHREGRALVRLAPRLLAALEKIDGNRGRENETPYVLYRKLVSSANLARLAVAELTELRAKYAAAQGGGA